MPRKQSSKAPTHRTQTSNLDGRTLVSWIGSADLNAADPDRRSDEIGPIAGLIEQIQFKRIVLLNDYGEEDERFTRFKRWLEARQDGLKILCVHAPSRLGNQDIGRIFRTSAKLIEKYVTRDEPSVFNTASGLPFMAFAMTLLCVEEWPNARPVRIDRAKPYEEVHLVPEVTQAMHTAISSAYWSQLHGTLDTPITFVDRTYVSTAMKRVQEMARKASSDRAHGTLITAPKGCPAEAIADFIAGLPGLARDTVKISCGTLSDESFVEEIFGRKSKGLLKDGDFETLVLVDVDKLSREMQKRLNIALRSGWIRSGERTIKKVSPKSWRTIATATEDLRADIASGDFDHEFFTLFAVHMIRVPPLHDRREDISEIVETVLSGLKQKVDLKLELASDAYSVLEQHSWPLNENELENTLRRAAMHSDSNRVTGRDIQEQIILPQTSENPEFPFGSGKDLDDVYREVREHWIRSALQRAGGVQSRAAELLRIKPTRLNNWIRCMEDDQV